MMVAGREHRYGSRVRPRVLALTGSILLLASCTFPGTQAGTEATLRSFPKDPSAYQEKPLLPGQPYGGAGAAWVSKDIKPVSDAKAIGGVAVVMSQEQEKLWLHGVEPATGKKTWSKPITPSRADPDTSVDFTGTDDGRVGFVELDTTVAGEGGRKNMTGRLVIWDPTGAGKEVAASPPMWFGSKPWKCESDPLSVCILDAKRTAMHKLSPDGKFITDKGPGAEYRLREDILITGGNLVLRKGGKDQWSVPLRGLLGEDFPFADFEIHDLREHGGFLALSGYTKEANRVQNWALTRATMPIADIVRLAVINASDGSLAWRRPGTRPCTREDRLRHGEYHFCQWAAGTLSTENGQSNSSGLRKEIFRADIKTGKEHWRVNLGEPVTRTGATSYQTDEG